MSTTDSTPRPGARVRVQKFGTFLSNMIMPNIGASSRGDCITALFIDGRLAAERRRSPPMVGPVDPPTCCPILIAYTGGRMVHDDPRWRRRASRHGRHRGSDLLVQLQRSRSPSATRARLGHDVHRRDDHGPAGGLGHEEPRRAVGRQDPPGLRDAGQHTSRPASSALHHGDRRLLGHRARSSTRSCDVLGNAVETLVDNNLLPLTSILIEPAKVFFLNNAINHGVLTPLGVDRGRRERQVGAVPARGQPRPRPGPAAGLHRSSARASPRRSAPGAAIIHFFGGIHEIYFPYVLMKPKLILAMIAGGMTGVVDQRRLRRGSAWLRQRPARSSPSTPRRRRGSYLGVTLGGGRIGGRDVRRRVASAQDRQGRGRRRPRCCHRRHGGDEGQEVLGRPARSPAVRPRVSGPISNIVFACDAGMGSSAMGASVLRKKIQAAGYGDVKVVNKSIANLDRHL